MSQNSTAFSPYRSDGKLYGFVCVVTGAAEPVGSAIVLELAAHGAACIYACDTTPNDSDYGCVATVEKQYPNTKVVTYPTATPLFEETLLILIDDILNVWGRLDIFVCNSALLGPPSLSSTTPTDLMNCFSNNAMVPFFALKYCPAAMSKLTPKGNYPNAVHKDEIYGSIIVVSSTASGYGGVWGPCFTVSSHAALGVVKSGVAALKGTSIRINCISPGQIDVGVNLADYNLGKSNSAMAGQKQMVGMQSKETQKESIGLERTGLPQEVAKVAGFLASGFSSYVHGANIIVDGGSTVMCPLTVPM